MKGQITFTMFLLSTLFNLPKIISKLWVKEMEILVMSGLLRQSVSEFYLQIL